VKLSGEQGLKPCGVDAGRARIYFRGAGKVRDSIIKSGVRDEYAKVRYMTYVP
jgi:hypothetical protein